MTPEEHKQQKPIHDAAVHSALTHLANKEAAFAHERYGYYRSPHEGFALIDEEVWEAHAEYDIVRGNTNWLQRCVYGNFNGEMAKVAGHIRRNALSLAQEAIHVAATAARFLQAMNAESGEFANMDDKTGK